VRDPAHCNLIDVQQLKNRYNKDQQMIKLGLQYIQSFSLKAPIVNKMIIDHNLDMLCLQCWESLLST